MGFGEVVDLSGIPFLSKTDLRGRFIATLTFYDGEWQMWMEIEPAGRFVKVHAWPAEAFYFAATPENDNDICSEFLNFAAQSANKRSAMRTFAAVQDDIFNLSASLAKLPIVHTSTSNPNGSARQAATEVEYILFVCRSVFDLLQEIVQNLWEDIHILDPAISKKALKKSFADMTLHADTLRTPEQIADRFHIPPALAECYAGNAPMFLKIRQFRDDLVHRGHRVQTIFRGDSEFLITKNLGSFRNIDIWREAEVIANGLAPLAPVLNLIVHGTLAACEDFAHTLAKHFRWYEPTVPGMKLFMRGYHNETLKQALADADSRLAEGRSLVTGMQHSPATP
ncbi:hypothetical protein HU230_0043445 (plasmid) [Bradyrhizobium quebecense]|uniref:hypothetical protein n=1 Tax=Bradyrhizobium quebecense TaxID=2748629 RepID=UPI001CD761D3|nr:hypothetical protein [Bradyrhizobium quebecense]UGA49064.1 hypothetical protein HU230_0043445 [Bradyrhizobium quebecense]